MRPTSNMIYTNTTFDSLIFSAAHVQQLCNTTFADCVVSPGTCLVEADAVLENVVFDNLACGDVIRISSDATLKEVAILGSKPKALVVRPDAALNEVQVDAIALEIPDYSGEVEIVGFGKDRVRFNQQLHVAVSADDFDKVDWKSLDIGPFSYWRIFHKKLKVFQASVGVFSLPPKKHRHYAATLNEMSKLQDLGLDFSND